MRVSVLLILFLTTLFSSCTREEKYFPYNPPGSARRTSDHTIDKYLGGMNIYFGNLHSHTNYSDGTMSNVDALLWARDSVQFDFYAITDHAELLTQQEWEDNKTKTDSLTIPGQFVAIRGFEWSSGYYGHIDAFRTADFTRADSISDLGLFYSWLAGHNAIAQFNHPGRDGNNFDSLAYKPETDSTFFSIETVNRDNPNNENLYLPFYQSALDNGWRIAPAANQDNHSMTATCHRTALIADALTQSSILDAMQKRRMYSTDDPNIRIVFKYNDHWMGSSVQYTGEASFLICVEDDEPILILELLSDSGTVKDFYTFGRDMTTVVWRPSVVITGKEYYYLKVYSNNLKDNDNTEQIAVTAPIWFNYQE